MPRGYWSAVLAAFFGLAAFGTLVVLVSGLGYPQPERYPAYRYTAHDEQGPNPATSGNVHAPEYGRPCNQPKGHDESDLCAQWRAANAATRAADWAAIQAWLSIAGIVGLAVTLLLTIRATNAAISANQIARDTIDEATRMGEAQVQAYLSISALSGIHTKNGLGFNIQVKNSGQSPAVEVFGSCCVIDKAGKEHTIAHSVNDLISAGSETTLATLYYPNILAQKWRGTAVKVAVAYADVFGNIYKIRSTFAGSPADWQFNEPTELIGGHHIASIFASGIVPPPKK